MVDTWKKLTSDKAAKIIDVDEHDESSLQFLKADMRPEEFIHELSTAQRWSEAVMVMARALPKREAVWWACICARNTEVLANNKEEAIALKVAEKWVFKPTEENRRDAFLQAQKSTTPSVGTMSCLAAAFSSGTLVLSNEQSIDLDATTFPKIVSGAVMISASEKGSDQFNTTLEHFLSKGKDIACGGKDQARG